MKQLEMGMFARSLAGHDKGKLYVVLESDGEFALLADGRLRTLDRPKRKRRKHIQPDYEISEILAEKIRGDQPVRDEDIRKAIRIKEV
jgi:ribosomal protein L14E/L6E/L27E